MKKTNLFIFDGHTEQLLTVLSNEDNNMAPFWEAPIEENLNGDFVFEFKTPINASLVEGNLVAYKDMDGDFQLFQIYKINDYHIDNQVNVHVWCEHAFYELTDDIVTDLRVENGTALDAMTKALSASRWQVGTVAELGTGTVNFYYSNATKNLQDVVATFGGELKYRVTIAGNRISGRFVDLLPRRGADTGKRFEYNKDLVEINRTVQVDGLKTALYGRGKGEQIETGGFSRKTTFADVVWVKANGDPVDKPAGQEFVGDPTALASWGRGNGARHRFGTYDYDTTDPALLLLRTWEQLQRVNVPKVTYQMKVIDLEKIAGLDHEKVRLGDTVFVIDRDLNLRIEARVVKIKPYLDAPENCEIILGNFIDDITTYNAKIDQMEATLTDRQGIWDKSDTALQTVTDSNIVNQAPSVPQNVSAVGLFKTIILKWTFDPSIAVSAYEVYASKVNNFTPDSTNLVFRGKTGGFTHNANTNETWYFRIRALNPAGTASAFTQQFSATTLQLATADFQDLAVSNEKVGNLSADKITFGTLDGTKATIVHINADQIDAGKVKAQFLSIGSQTTFETNYDPTTKATQDSLVEVEKRVTNVEFYTTEESIISTVRSSLSYKNDLDARAKADDLKDYATTVDLNQAKTDLEAYADKAVNDLDLSDYATNSYVDQTANSLDIKFTSSGGVNLLKNSAGFNSTNFWTVTLDKDINNVVIGSVTTIQNAELEEKGVGSGFVLRGAKLTQTIVNSPQSHTIATVVKKGTAGSGYIKVTYTDQNGVSQVVQRDFVAGTTYDYKQEIINISTGSNTIIVELYGTTDSGIIFTGTMANVGLVALQWQHSAGEIYNTNVLMDMNGIKVNNSSGNGYTLISPYEFSGYSLVPDVNNNPVMTRVFTLNNDVTEVSKIDVDKEISMAPAKIVPVQSDTYTGWAIVAG